MYRHVVAAVPGGPTILTLDDFQQLQRRVAAARTARDQAAGARDALRERLAAEYGVSDRDAATAKLAKLQRREDALRDEYTAAYDAFQAKYANQLGGK